MRSVPDRLIDAMNNVDIALSEEIDPVSYPSGDAMDIARLLIEFRQFRHAVYAQYTGMAPR